MIAYSTTDLNKIFRGDMRDKLSGLDDGSVVDSESLWKEDEIYRYMTIAIDALSKKVGGRYKIFKLPVAILQNVIYVPRAVLEIRSARLLTAGVTLLEANANQYLFRERDDYGRGIIGAGGPFGATGSPASHYIRDYDVNGIRLVPTPTAPDILELQCDVTSTYLCDSGMPLPFSDTEDQVILLHHMKWQAYMKHDADTEDLPRAKLYEALYERASDDRRDALRNYRRAPGQVAMNW